MALRAIGRSAERVGKEEEEDVQRRVDQVQANLHGTVGDELMEAAGGGESEERERMEKGRHERSKDVEDLGARPRIDKHVAWKNWSAREAVETTTGGRTAERKRPKSSPTPRHPGMLEGVDRLATSF